MTEDPRTIVPCLWFADQAEEAARLYEGVFGGRTTLTTRYPQGKDTPSGRPPGSVLTVEVELGGQRFSLLNGGPMFRPNHRISFFAFHGSAKETDRRFAALADGGTVMMPLDSYPWSPRYAWVQDRYGFSWQLITGEAGSDRTIVPCFMFSGATAGKAGEAMTWYTGRFVRSAVESVSRYEPGEGPTESVKHARFTLLGQPFAAMDSHQDPGAPFTEAVSLQVLCADQAQIDRTWADLTAGGEEGQCGWLKDRYGVSWQVAPANLSLWTGDPRALGRVFEAMMPMRKIDLATLERARAGA